MSAPAQCVSIMARLREGTAAEHQALEGTLPLMSPELTVEGYVECLREFEAFVRAWEAAGARACPAEYAAMFRGRMRTPLLERDLAFFGAKKMEDTPELPELATDAQFWGAMYVMEGSTLGGRFIAKHLEETFGFAEGRGYSYFSGHGADTGRMWKEFGEVLTREAAALPQDEMVASANAMFRAFHRWFEVCTAQRAGV